MKDALGHGSDGKGGAADRVAEPAAHQAGIHQLQPSLAEGRELYASLMAHAQAKSAAAAAADPKGRDAGYYNGGFSKGDLSAMGGREQRGAESVETWAPTAYRDGSPRPSTGARR